MYLLAPPAQPEATHEPSVPTPSKHDLTGARSGHLPLTILMPLQGSVGALLPALPTPDPGTAAQG